MDRQPRAVPGASRAGGPPRGGEAGRPGRSVPWVTPDAVELDLATATVGSRGIAYLIDLAIILAGLLLVGLAEAILGVTGFVPGWAGLALLLLFAFLLQFGYPIGFEVLMRGRTPGKAAMGLRVVTIEGLPVGIRHATVRAVIGLLELLGTFGILAVISSLVSSRGQRLGDLAAGTVVLRERRAGGRPEAMTFPPPAGWEPYVARLDVSGLGSQERAAVRETLRRIEDLPATARDRVVSQLVGTLAPRVAPPPPDGMHREVWLRCVAAAIQETAATWSPAGARAQQPGPSPTPPVPTTPSTGEQDPPADPPGSQGFRPPS